MFFRKKVLLAKVETTYGTDSSPAGSDAVLTKNLSIQPYNGPTVTRDLDRSTLGAQQQINTAPSVQVTFDVELAGAGTAGDAPGWGACLQAAGWSETVDAGVDVTYGPISASFKSATLKFHLDGQVHTVLGARGNVSFGISRGQIPTLSFSFVGLYQRPAAGSVTADFSAYIVPVAVTDDNTPTFDVFSTAVVAESLSIDMGNNVVHRNLIGSDQVFITDRNATGQMVIEAPAIGTKNWFADVESHAGITDGALQIIHGTTAGNIIQIDAPKVQISSIEPANSDGLVVYNMGLIFAPDSGNDEVSITVS